MKLSDIRDNLIYIRGMVDAAHFISPSESDCETIIENIAEHINFLEKDINEHLETTES